MGGGGGGPRTLWLAPVALVCFAANSVLARLALRTGAIDPAAFTAIRLASGALFLALFLSSLSSPSSPSSPSSLSSPSSRFPVLPPLLLFLYAAPFSFAYLGLTAGTGALILFGAVQLTMIGAGLRSGERPHRREWIGLAISGLGLLYLNLPGVAAPPAVDAGLMALAGVAWGCYSLRGRKSVNPLSETASSFLLATPLGIGLLLAALPTGTLHFSPAGIGWAVASGALASGGGYAAWYAVLPRLSATRAGTIQLAVPALAALAGNALLGEPISLRLVLSGAAVLGGIGLAISARR